MKICKILSLSGAGSLLSLELGIIASLFNNKQYDYNFDIISGISSGGLISSFLSYYDNIIEGIDDLKNILENINNDDVYKKDILKIYNRWSIYDTYPLENTLKKILLNKTNLTNNDRITLLASVNMESLLLNIYEFKKLNFSQKIKILMASTAIPFLFPPIQIDNKYYIDGGMISNELIFQSLRYKNCDSYEILYIGAFNRFNYKNISSLNDYSNRLLQLIFNTFNNELYDILNINCSYPIGKITMCNSNYDKLNEYSILDFNQGKKLFEIGYNYNQCKDIIFC